MSLAGFRLLDQLSADFRIAKDLSIRVAQPSLIVLLKMVSYLDRPADRNRDLQDIAYLWTTAYENDPEQRVSDIVVQAGIDFHSTDAFLLGHALGPHLNDAECNIISNFLNRLRDNGNSTARIPMLRQGPSHWRRNEDRLDATLGAYLRGLSFR